MNTQIRLPLIAIGCIALVTASCSHKKSGVSDEAPVIDVAAVTVDSVTVHRSFPAYLTANRSVDLVARVNSTLTSRQYKEGDFVKEGTVLFTFDPTQYAEAVSRARAALDDAEASYRYAADHYAAVEKALESDAVSRMEVLQAKSAKEAAEASIASSRAQLKTAETTLSYCTVRAPFDGHVSMSEYSAGAYLAGEGAPIKLCTIYDDAVVLVNFSIDNTEFAKLKAKADSSGIGAMLHRIPVIFDNPTQYDYTADIYYMSPVIDKSTGAMRMQAEIDNSRGELRAGMYSSVAMPVEHLDSAILVRDASIATDQLGKYLYVVNDSDRVVYTPVKTGETVADTMRIITSGLKRGDRYVTSALLKVRDGMTVNPRTVK